MSIKKVYSGLLQTDIINTSDYIDEATALFLVVPDDVDDWTFEVFLQVEINAFDNRRIRLEDDFYEFDTTIIIHIPEEYRFIGLSKYVAVVSNISVNIEIWAVIPTASQDTPILESIEQLLKEINLSNNLIAFNQAAQNTALIAIAGGVGAAASVITGGASLALPGAVNQILLPSTPTVLLPLLP